MHDAGQEMESSISLDDLQELKQAFHVISGRILLLIYILLLLSCLIYSDDRKQASAGICFLLLVLHCVIQKQNMMDFRCFASEFYWQQLNKEQLVSHRVDGSQKCIFIKLKWHC